MVPQASISVQWPHHRQYTSSKQCHPLGIHQEYKPLHKLVLHGQAAVQEPPELVRG